MLDSFSFFLFYSFISNKHKLVCILYQFVYIQRLYHTKKAPNFEANIERSPPSFYIFFCFIFLIKKMKNFLPKRTEQTLRFTTIVNKYIFYIYSYKSFDNSIFFHWKKSFPGLSSRADEWRIQKTKKFRKYKYYF